MIKLTQKDWSDGNNQTVFSDFFRHIGSHNFLVIGIITVVAWLLISGLKKGLKKRGQNKGQNNNTD